MTFPFIRQDDEMDCGAVCLQMLMRFYGCLVSIHELRERCFTNESGSSLYSISEAAESYGLKSTGYQCDLNSFLNDAPLPALAHWQQNHFVVVYKKNKKAVWVADPALGKIKYSHSEFLVGFGQTASKEGIILTFEPTSQLHSVKGNPEILPKPWGYLWRHMSRYKVLMYQVLIAVFASSLLAISLPLLTQALIDEGVVNQDYTFIKALAISQLVLFVGKVSFDALRSWIVLHWSYRINISMISSFLMDFLGLSATTLSKKSPADTLQRIEDYQHVEQFIAGISINLVLSSITFLLFSIILITYHIPIFFVFMLGTLLSVAWLLLFQKRRKIIYYKLIGLMTQNKSKVIEIIEGLHEIKSFGLERKMRWNWEDVQVKEYEAILQNLKIEQTQKVGFQAINEVKNILIVLLGALAVMNGELSLGAVLAVVFISGQLNNSLSFIPEVFHVAQEAKVSIERLIQVSNIQNLKSPKSSKFETGDIEINNVSYSYDGFRYALDEVSLKIPKGKTIAIVGLSGSGKTTILKLLSRFLNPTEGSIKIAGNSLEHLDENVWRKHVGVVSQDGYIFSDTVLNNISISADIPSMKKAILCAKITNIHEEIDDLPNGYHTKIGENGVTLSKGQYQRILIARAIYKNPQYLFFDEATSALDSFNEKVIQNRLQKVFKNKTVLIIAHRLSTVQHADNIIVLEKGKVIEEGNHISLIQKKGAYFNLVKDQLMLGE